MQHSQSPITAGYGAVIINLPTSGSRYMFNRAHLRKLLTGKRVATVQDPSLRRTNFCQQRCLHGLPAPTGRDELVKRICKAPLKKAVCYYLECYTKALSPRRLISGI
ncbi:MAG: hypothetical protein QOC84_206 [Bradyrhizobium sp.]|nr:hypothetical protein [Bradyrhizobium sp.]